jgi:sugar phosphate isomerase/epimerase
MGPEHFASALPTVMTKISEIGFAGFETALAVLPLDDPHQFAAWRAGANDLVLAAAHTGGAWWEQEAERDLPELVGKLAKLPALGCNRAMVSMGRGVVDLDAPTLRRTGELLGELANRAAVTGVEIAIHNHAHELADDARVLHAIFDAASGTPLKLGADIGWVRQGGVDPVTFIGTFGSLLSYLHVRDYGTPDGFIEVGRGSMDWSGIGAALDRAGYRGWLVAESEFNDLWRGETDPETTARLQIEGMRREFAGG